MIASNFCTVQFFVLTENWNLSFQVVLNFESFEDGSRRCAIIRLSLIFDQWFFHLICCRELKNLFSNSICFRKVQNLFSHLICFREFKQKVTQPFLLNEIRAVKCKIENIKMQIWNSNFKGIFYKGNGIVREWSAFIPFCRIKGFQWIWTEKLLRLMFFEANLNREIFKADVVFPFVEFWDFQFSANLTGIWTEKLLRLLFFFERIWTEKILRLMLFFF